MLMYRLIYLERGLNTEISESEYQALPFDVQSKYRKKQPDKSNTDEDSRKSYDDNYPIILPVIDFSSLSHDTPSSDSNSFDGFGGGDFGGGGAGGEW